MYWMPLASVIAYVCPQQRKHMQAILGHTISVTDVEVPMCIRY
jgi:hypothetical protein